MVFHYCPFQMGTWGWFLLHEFELEQAWHPDQGKGLGIWGRSINPGYGSVTDSPFHTEMFE